MIRPDRTKIKVENGGLTEHHLGFDRIEQNTKVENGGFRLANRSIFRKHEKQFIPNPNDGMSETSEPTNGKVTVSMRESDNNDQTTIHPVIPMFPGPYLLAQQEQPQRPSPLPFPVRVGSEITGPYSLIVNDPSNKVRVRKRINRANTYKRYPPRIVEKRIMETITSSPSSSPSADMTTQPTTTNNNDNIDPTITTYEPSPIEDKDEDDNDNHVDVFSNDDDNNEDDNVEDDNIEDDDEKEKNQDDDEEEKNQDNNNPTITMTNEPTPNPNEDRDDNEIVVEYLYWRRGFSTDGVM